MTGRSVVVTINVLYVKYIYAHIFIFCMFFLILYADFLCLSRFLFFMGHDA